VLRLAGVRALATMKHSPVARVREAFFPARVRQTGAAIVPEGSVAGRALVIVLAIQCFLACLTAGAVYMVNQSAAAWMNDVSSEVTVQVPTTDGGDVEKRMTEISLFLARQKGVAEVRPLSASASAELLEPWLGQNAALDALPVPRMIALEIDPAAPPDFNALRTALEGNFPGTALDDHRRWQAEIRTFTRSLALGGLSILALVAAATIAVVISATKSAMASNREIVEVLHLVGAKERFIAHEFERHFLTLGVRAGLIGAGAAAVVFLALPFVTNILGGGLVASAEIRRLVGTAALDWPGYFLLAVVVIVIAALCMMTSRYGVQRILKAQQ
jgi:cell division transport system permease protein